MSLLGRKKFEEVMSDEHPGNMKLQESDRQFRAE